MTKVEDGKLSDFRPQTENANVHTERGLKALSKAYDEVGYVAPMTAAASGEIIDGSARLERAFDQFDDEVLVVKHDGKRPIVMIREDVEDANSPLAKQISYKANRISEIDLKWNPERIWADLEAGVELGDLFREDELKEILGELGKEEPQEPGPPPIDRAAELQEKWGTALGQVWTLGEHRLACGDCTDRAVVEGVMGGERADMVFSDPPYNVSYQDNESIESLKKQKRRTDGLIIGNDSMTDNEFGEFLRTALENSPISKGNSFYLCAPAGHTETLFRNTINSVSGWLLKQCIVWVKDQFVLGRQDYHYRHESILYGWVEGAAHYFLDDRTQDTVWEIDRPRISEFHPTMKPVELPMRAIKNSSKASNIVYDPFLGSGTTLIAAHQLNRRCRGIEISPAYVAVTLERFHQATQIEPELTNG